MQLNILSRRTFYFIAGQKEFSFLRKRIPDSCDKSFWNCDFIHKICILALFPTELSISLPAKKNSRSWEKNSRFLWQEFLKLQFFSQDLQLNIRKNSLLRCLLESILVLEKRTLVARVPEIEILLKIFWCNTILAEEFSSIRYYCRNLDSPWKNQNKMIVMVGILALNRRKCY